MKILASLFAAAGMLLASPLQAAEPGVSPVPHFGSVVSLPSAANQPDPALVYRVVFDIDAATGDKSAPHPCKGCPLSQSAGYPGYPAV